MKRAWFMGGRAELSLQEEAAIIKLENLLIELMCAHGLAVTVKTVSNTQPTMGTYDLVIDVRRVRGQP